MGIDIDYNLWEKEARERAALQEEESLAKDVLMLLEQLSFERRVNKRVCGIARELAGVRDAAEKLHVVADDYGEPVLSAPGKLKRWEMVENIKSAFADLSDEAKEWPSEKDGE